MKALIASVICLVAGHAVAANWRPNERLLHAVRFVESSHGAFIIGDNGQSLGDFQLSEAAWVDVNSWRASRKLKTYSYDHHVYDRKVNREYAADYLSILHGQLKKRLNRPPTPEELYAAYNMGLSSFAQCKFRLSNINATTARKCQQIKEIMSDE